jgi:hypothetical protein
MPRESPRGTHQAAIANRRRPPAVPKPAIAADAACLPSHPNPQQQGSTGPEGRPRGLLSPAPEEYMEVTPIAGGNLASGFAASQRVCAGCALPKTPEEFKTAKARNCRDCLRRRKRTANKRWYKTEKGRACRRTEEQRRKRRPRARYNAHRMHAAARGVPFLLSFPEWWQLWQQPDAASGGKPFWSQRGYGPGRYCMARHGDKGPYAVGNVSIVTNEQNTAEANNRLRQPSAEYNAATPRVASNLPQKGASVKETPSQWTQH